MEADKYDLVSSYATASEKLTVVASSREPGSSKLIGRGQTCSLLSAQNLRLSQFNPHGMGAVHNLHEARGLQKFLSPAL